MKGSAGANSLLTWIEARNYPGCCTLRLPLAEVKKRICHSPREPLRGGGRPTSCVCPSRIPVPLVRPSVFEGGAGRLRASRPLSPLFGSAPRGGIALRFTLVGGVSLGGGEPNVNSLYVGARSRVHCRASACSLVFWAFRTDILLHGIVRFVRGVRKKITSPPAPAYRRLPHGRRSPVYRFAFVF
jgi:hypothetical protein